MSLWDEVCQAQGEAWADDAFFIFTLMVSGRRPLVMLRKWEALMEHRTRWPTPRDLELASRMVRRWVKLGVVPMKLRELRTGQYRRISGAFEYWAETGLDLASVRRPRELEKVPGVGPRCACFFGMYRRWKPAVDGGRILRLLVDYGMDMERHTFPAEED